uniref:MULE transposase domain-containing protein n=1 Tax=Lactuca sativa TaxID=4236 RepID=A0A9R1WGF0_LACSA|nr:hypothetical protein LSAT_V11C200073640 [Lactuca sativa]
MVYNQDNADNKNNDISDNKVVFCICNYSITLILLKDAENENEFINGETDDIIADDNIDLQKEQSHVTHYYVSPGCSPYWILVVSYHIKPKINSTLDSYGLALSMCNNYGSEAGFDVRLGTIGTMKFDIITCTTTFAMQSGRSANMDILDPQQNKIQRRKDSFRCECKTKIVFILLHGTNKYILLMILSNNVLMSCLVRTTCFCPVQRGNLIILGDVYSQPIKEKYWCLKSTYIGGSYVRGGLVSDFKNSTRNLNSYIGSRDAKFLVVNMMERKKNIPTFSFKFKVVQKKLNALFWADETAKYNYNAFGDVVSLDATFNMNKYDMVFVPFTGIDNHKKCVTFGGLLSREDGSSYSWLLRAFLKALKKQSKLVLTDQDPTLNKVVNEVLPISSHRWNHMILIKHGNLWMKKMYALQRHWVPAFFKHIPMSGLMRTTSLSESQNWSFQNVERKT